jgi:chorismate mutase
MERIHKVLNVKNTARSYKLSEVRMKRIDQTWVDLVLETCIRLMIELAPGKPGFLVIREDCTNNFEK